MKGGARRSEVAPEEEEKKNPKNPHLVPPYLSSEIYRISFFKL